MSRRWAPALTAPLALLVACSGGAAEGRAPAPAPPSVTFLGDSWTAGIGATRTDGFPELTAERLAWRHTVLGSPGSGYVEPGRDGPFGTRIADAVAGAPDVIVVQGSLNDSTADPQELAAAVSDTLVRLRSEADPDTEIVVLGASHTPGTSTTLIDRINTLLDAAADDAGLHFVDVAAENWTDPADPDLWADPVHPNDGGYERIADRLAPVLAEVLGA